MNAIGALVGTLLDWETRKGLCVVALPTGPRTHYRESAWDNSLICLPGCSAEKVPSEATFLCSLSIARLTAMRVVGS